MYRGGIFDVTPVKTAAYTAKYGELVRCDTTSAAFTVTTPTAKGCPGKSFKVYSGPAASSNNVTVDGHASETINGSATKALSTNAAVTTFTSDGTNWIAG